MPEVTDFRGTSEQLATFVTGVWRDDYAGKMPFPMWTAEFFDWQFRMRTDSPSHNLLAVYDGENIAAVLLGADYDFRTPLGQHRGSQWSWLSIAPQYRGQGMAKALDAERVRRQREADTKLIVSYRYVGSHHSLAERPNTQSKRKKFLRKVGFWARVLSPAKLAAWNISRTEAVLTKAAAPFIPIPKRNSRETQIRDFQESDLERCLELTRQSSTTMPVAIHWNFEELRHQLAGSPITQTVVAEENGTVAGFVNFHVLPFQGRTVEPVGVIDLAVVDSLSGRLQRQLVHAACANMLEKGAVLALKLRCGDAPSSLMWRTNFVPQPANSYLVFQWVNEIADVKSNAKLQLLWR